MLPLQDILILVGIALVAAASVTVAGLIGSRLARRASILIQLGIVSVSSVLSVVLAVVLASSAMYVSPHDLSVVLTMSVISAVISLAVAVFLGRTFARRSAELTRLARAIGQHDASIVQERDVQDRPVPQATAELARLAEELEQTGRRLAESRAAEAAAEAARRDLIAHVSHDLRTPLAGLRAMAEALEDGLVEEPDRYYRLMRGQVSSLTSMVDDLFELSRIQAGALRLHLEPVSVADLVSDVVAELQVVSERQHVEVRSTGEQAAPVIMGDARELSRVISNMLVNAVEHTPAGGVVDISTQEVADHLLLSVANTGVGIPDAHLERVFETGWRGDPARTSTIDGLSGGGLGLAIVRGIVEAHDGSVSVRNIPGGCRFDVRLPRTLSVA